MKSFTFRAFRRPSKGAPFEDGERQKEIEKESRLKRREQVRKAQRTYRERREEYVKSLETEVVQLRANEANLLHQTKKLYAEISHLKDLLSNHGIEPSSLPEPSPASESPMNLAASKRKSVIFMGKGFQTGQQLHVRKINSQLASPTEEPYSLEQTNNEWPATSPSVEDQSGFGATLSSDDSLIDASKPQQDLTKRLGNLCPTTIGMEFVLTLESPCFDHIHGDPKNPHAPSNHALTASAPLLFYSTEPSSNRMSTSPSWEAPDEMLERLLSLAPDLKGEGEITPIQAWNYIRQRSEFDDVEAYRIKRLIERLLKHVKCYGFGAVIDQAIFENMVFETFVAARVFEAPYRTT